MDVGGHCLSSDQQIWTLMDVSGPSGNTLKVPGSRPGRPTKSCKTLNDHAHVSHRSQEWRIGEGLWTTEHSTLTGNMADSNTYQFPQPETC